MTHLQRTGQPKTGSINTPILHWKMRSKGTNGIQRATYTNISSGVRTCMCVCEYRKRLILSNQRQTLHCTALHCKRATTVSSRRIRSAKELGKVTFLNNLSINFSRANGDSYSVIAVHLNRHQCHRQVLIQHNIRQKLKLAIIPWIRRVIRFVTWHSSSLNIHYYRIIQIHDHFFMKKFLHCNGNLVTRNFLQST